MTTWQGSIETMARDLCGIKVPLSGGGAGQHITLRRCPLTHGVATKVTRTAWERDCSARLARNRGHISGERPADVSPEDRWCASGCTGDPPPEVEFVAVEYFAQSRCISPDEKAEKNEPARKKHMTTAQKSPSPAQSPRPQKTPTRIVAPAAVPQASRCVVCGGSRTPGRPTNMGQPLCCSCERISAALRRRPQVITALADRLGVSLVPVAQPATDAAPPAEIESLRARLAEQEAAEVEASRLLDQITTEARDTLREREALAGENEALRFQLDQLRRDLAEKTADKWNGLSSSDGTIIPDGYESLWSVLDDAADQAANGKGKVRHAVRGQAFEEQQICTITRDVGQGFPLGQAKKKIVESLRLPWPQARAELLGAINYLAAAIIVGDENGVVQSAVPPRVNDDFLAIDEAA